MKRYFRIPLLVVGYFLCVQAGLGALFAIGQPENLVAIWVISFGVATVGYGLIKTARRWRIENQPTVGLYVPETNRLDRP